MIFQCIHQAQNSLTYQTPMLFSKEHVISGSHPDNLVCRWDPLDSPKKWPKWSRLSGSSGPLSILMYTLPTFFFNNNHLWMIPNNHTGCVLCVCRAKMCLPCMHVSYIMYHIGSKFHNEVLSGIFMVKVSLLVHY